MPHVILTYLFIVSQKKKNLFIYLFKSSAPHQIKKLNCTNQSFSLNTQYINSLGPLSKKRTLGIQYIYGNIILTYLFIVSKERRTPQEYPNFSPLQEFFLSRHEASLFSLKCQSLRVFPYPFLVSFSLYITSVFLHDMEHTIVDSLKNLQLTKEEEEDIFILSNSTLDLLEECALSLFGRLLADRHQNQRAIKNTLRLAWKMGSDLRIVEVGKNILQFKFSSMYQLEWVERSGPWNFENSLLLLC